MRHQVLTVGGTWRKWVRRRRRQRLVADAAFDGGVAFAGVDDDFLFFAFLVVDDEGAAVGLDEFDFDFVEFAVVGAGGGGVGEAVLVAEECDDFAEDAGDFAVELGEPGVAAGSAGRRS